MKQPSKYCIIGLISVAVLCPLCVFAPYWDISRKGWLELEELQDYICLLSIGYQDNNYTRGIGWFCVKEENCPKNRVGNPIPLIKGEQPRYQCKDFRYNEDRDVCCYIGGLVPPLDVPQEDYGTYLVVKNTSTEGDLTSLREYKEFLNFKTSNPKKASALETHEICGLLPTGVQDNFTVYQPYVCVASDACTEVFPIDEYVPLRYGDVGQHLCEKSSSGQVCCHMSVAVDKSDPQKTWEYKEFLPEQKYAPGFRSSFMCEQYSRLVCDGRQDRCALRMLKRDTAVPGEFPHQALIGVTSHRIQFFHCAGSLVSKDFILSAYDCQTYDGLDASLALVGDYNIAQYQETNSFEQITYIKKHYTEIESHFFLLMRLWRPLKLNYLVRPACLDWFSKADDSYYRSQEFMFESAWLTGYGPVTKKDKFNETIKRYRYTWKDRRDVDRCLWRVPDNKKNNFVLGESMSHLCLNHGKRFSLSQHEHPDRKAGQGFFDMGAPLTIINNYCSWNLYGLSIQNHLYTSKPPTLIETIPHALQWIENIVWKDDFDLLSFNMSLPDCASVITYTFYPMNFLKDVYNEFYEY